MLQNSKTSRWLAACASFGLLIPAPLFAEGKVNANKAAAPATAVSSESNVAETAPPRPEGQQPKAKAFAVVDVALGEGGKLTGQMQNAAGESLEGAVVVLKQGDKEISKTLTDDEGRFSMAELKGGVYQLQSANGQRSIRLWTADTAPPQALKEVTFVNVPPTAVRGQFGSLEPFNATATILGVVGVAMAGFAISDLEKIKKDVQIIKKQTP